MDNTTTSGPEGSSPLGGPQPQTQFAMLDFLFPGFSMFSSALYAYLGIDLNVYIPLLAVISSMTFAWSYMSSHVWGTVEKHLMSTVRIRTDDEMYNIMMSWVALQRFSKGSRRFFANLNINSRAWALWNWDDDDDAEDTEESDGTGPKKKPLQYTPSFGTHFFWYNGNLLLFERHENREQSAFLNVSEREELSVSCFGRNPRILKELLIEARLQYLKKDESKTLIYRGTAGGVGGDPAWQRCMSRSSRPFSTVILNEKVKKSLIDDVRDYVHPVTRRWYANRGIPYRRGYLLYGPPGTGKSSLSLALAGFFKMRIYMVSLSSVTASEDSLSSLFAELPRRCVVLLEDIDTAGLTHTREEGKGNDDEDEDEPSPAPAPVPTSAPRARSRKPTTPVPPGRLSLSGLLNILDGVASQEGRILIMTTNHLEKLDKALIRPGRVDMIVKFGLADAEISASIFRAIYAPYEGEDPVTYGPSVLKRETFLDEDELQKATAMEAQVRDDTMKHIGALAEKFAAKVPELEFSPAEIQGLLLRHKRDPETAIEHVEEWVVQTRREKKEKEIEDAEKRRKEEKKRKKEEEKKKKKAEKKKAQKRKQREERRKNGEDSGSSDSDSNSNSDTESEEEEKLKKTKIKAEKNNEEKKVEGDNQKENEEGANNKNSDGDGENSVPGTKETESENENENKANDDGKATQTRSNATSDSGYDTPEKVY